MDTQRLKKHTRAEKGQEQGEVALLRFDDQCAEANGVAELCRRLIEQDGLGLQEILILLRVDTRKAFSQELERAFREANIPLATDISSHSPLDDFDGRQVLSILRLVHKPDDHLAWRTIIKVRRNRIGDGAINAIYDYAQNKGEQFCQTIRAIVVEPSLLPRYGESISKEIQCVSEIVEEFRTDLESYDYSMEALLDRILEWVVDEEERKLEIKHYFLQVANIVEATKLEDLLVAIETSNEDIEQELEVGKINVLTMHKAKGLTASAVIVMAAEDEHIPGRQTSEPELGDERRLLFVSLTRAKHKLFITYCNLRSGQQRMLGRNSGDPRRTLTRFLRHVPLRPVSGSDYIRARAT